MGLSERCKQWLADEELLFDQDYQCHAIAGESKDKTIGKPYLLYQPNNKKGVLLIHGLMAAPFEVSSGLMLYIAKVIMCMRLGLRAMVHR